MNGDSHHPRAFHIRFASVGLLLCFAFGTPALADTPTGPPESPGILMTYPFNLSGPLGLCGGSEEREKAILAAYPEIATRAENTLTLCLGNGKLMLFKDILPPPQTCDGIEDYCRFSLLAGYLPELGFYLVQECYYEDFSVLLIGIADGKVYRFPANPYLSPDKQRILIYPNSPFGDDNDRLEIWRINGKGNIELEKRFEDMPVHAGPEAYWINKDTIEIWDPSPSKIDRDKNIKYYRLWGKVQLIDGKWQVENYRQGIEFPVQSEKKKEGAK